MDYILLFFGFFLVIGGVIGSFLPVIPGPPTGWVGLLLLHLTDGIPNNWTFLAVTFVVAIIVFIADYIIPVLGTKKFGGTKYGIWGSTIGLIIGLIFTPIGMILGLFLGAFIGELINNAKDVQKALKASLGSVIGFFFSTGIKLVVGVVFLVYFINILIEHRDAFI